MNVLSETKINMLVSLHNIKIYQAKIKCTSNSSFVDYNLPVILFFLIVWLLAILITKINSYITLHIVVWNRGRKRQRDRQTDGERVWPKRSHIVVV